MRGESAHPFQLTGTNQFHGKGTDEKSKKRRERREPGRGRKWSNSRAEVSEEEKK